MTLGFIPFTLWQKGQSAYYKHLVFQRYVLKGVCHSVAQGKSCLQILMK